MWSNIQEQVARDDGGFRALFVKRVVVLGDASRSQIVVVGLLVFPFAQERDFQRIIFVHKAFHTHKAFGISRDGQTIFGFHERQHGGLDLFGLEAQGKGGHVRSCHVDCNVCLVASVCQSAPNRIPKDFFSEHYCGIEVSNVR